MSMRLSAVHQSATEAANGSRVRTRNARRQVSGINTWPRLPPRMVMNRPNGMKKIWPASWNGRLIRCRKDSPA
jgi:hypothetical protein